MVKEGIVASEMDPLSKLLADPQGGVILASICAVQ